MSQAGVEIKQVTQDMAAHVQMIGNLIVSIKAQRVLELGTDVGDSTRIISAALKQTGGKLWTIDVKPLDWNWKELGNVEALTGNSLDFIPDRLIDLLFIDDDHTYPHVLNELRKFVPCVRPGGYILLHDVLNKEHGPGVQRSIEEFCSPLKWGWSIFPNSHGMAVIQTPTTIVGPAQVGKAG